MTAIGVALGNSQGLAVSQQLLAGDLSLVAAAGFVVPLGALCWVGVVAADKLPEFAQLRQLFQDQLIPQLRPLPIWGLGLLALGAGVGEETLFRAFMQSTAIQGLTAVLPGSAATTVGLVGTSLVFGALHALTPAYFAFATAAGLVFGVEYLAHGLQTAAATHFLYDWAALVYILKVWDNSSGGSGGGKGAVAPAPAQGAEPLS